MGGLGCDNMTVIIVCFLHNETYSELVRKCCQESLSTRDTRLGSPDNAHSSSANGHVLYNSENVFPEEEVLFSRIPTGGISKLNDTLSTANTDLDYEIASSSPKKSYGETINTGMNGVKMDYDDEGVEYIEEQVSVKADDTHITSDPELDPFPAIETTV